MSAIWKVEQAWIINSTTMQCCLAIYLSDFLSLFLGSIRYASHSQLTCINKNYRFMNIPFDHIWDAAFRRWSTLTFPSRIQTRFVLISEHTMQASSHCLARCRIHRSTRTRRIHLSWRGECPSAIIEFILEDSWSSSRVGIDTTASWGNSQCKLLCNWMSPETNSWMSNFITVSSSTKYGSARRRQNSVESSSKLHW